MIEYIAKDEMDIRIENAIDDAKAIDRDDYHHGIVKGLEKAMDIVNQVKIRSTFRGRWISEEYLIISKKWIARCNCCHGLFESEYMPSGTYNWCPMCGAYMTNRNVDMCKTKISECNLKFAIEDNYYRQVDKALDKDIHDREE